MNIAVNGSIIEEQQAVVSVYDHGFLYGIGLFETFRTYQGRPFLLERHFRRLAEGCEELGIEFTPDSAACRQLVQALLAANELTDAYFRFTVTAGIDALGLPQDSYGQPHTVMYVKPLPPVSPEPELQGKALQLLRLPRNSPEGTRRHKSLHYMNNVLAKRELQRRADTPAGAEGLFLDEKGRLAEGIVSNLFFIRSGRLCTPSLATGILPGITRAFVLELAAKAGLPTEEGLYGWDDLRAAEEVFLTNSIQELVPVTQLLDTEGRRHTIGDGAPGRWTRTLLANYRTSAFAGKMEEESGVPG